MSPQEKAAGAASDFVDKLNSVIIFPLIALLTAVAFLVFLWGCAQYVINADNDQARQEGVKHMTYGILGLVVMVSAYAILAIFAATFGLSDQLECANNPDAGGCGDVFRLPDTGSVLPPASDPNGDVGQPASDPNGDVGQPASDQAPTPTPTTNPHER